MADLRRRDAVHDIVLPPLELSAIAELVALRGRDDPDGAFSERLHRETGGLPLLADGFLRDLARGASGDEVDWRPPSNVQELLRARLETVSPAARDLAVTVAVFSRPVDLDTLLGAGDVHGTSAVAALEELLRTGILEERFSEVATTSSPTYGFTLSAMQSLVYEEASAARRRLVHGRAADAMCSSPAPATPARLAAVAQHLRFAGRDRHAVETYVEAAEAARQVVALEEALDHLRSALSLARQPGGRAPRVGR